MTKGPLRRAYGPLLESLYGEFRRERLRLLCQRLGVEFAENVEAELEMWAEIGERLAQQQPEFLRPTSKGRPSKYEKAEVAIARMLDARKTPGETDSQTIERLIASGELPARAVGSYHSAASRGRAKQRCEHWFDQTEDRWSLFEEHW